MITVKSSSDPVAQASQWLLHSGIQSCDGGIYAWYDMNARDYPFLYSEITGYGITSFLFLHTLYKENEYIRRAKSAAGWIVNRALHPCGGVLTRLYGNAVRQDAVYAFDGENIFAFDSGMVLFGLVNLYRFTKEAHILDAAVTIGDFIVTRMQRQNGALSPIYNAKAKEQCESCDKWSNQPGSFLSKVALGLVELYAVTRSAGYKKSAIRLCEYALTCQAPEGRFITDRKLQTTNLHPHCYSVEGLLYAGVSFNIPVFVEAARKGTQWIFEHVNERGINELYEPGSGSFSRFQRADVLAQSLRLGLLLGHDAQGVEYLGNILRQYQYAVQEDRQCGGFFYSHGERHLNSWCTMFALQALALYQDRNLVPENGKLALYI